MFSLQLTMSNLSAQTRLVIRDCDLITNILLSFNMTCSVYKVFYRHGVTEMQREIIIKREEAVGRT